VSHAGFFEEIFEDYSKEPGVGKKKPVKLAHCWNGTLSLLDYQDIFADNVE